MFQDFFNSIQTQYMSGEESSELTYRTALENLLNSFVEKHIKRGLNIKHEPLKQGKFGRPDFKVVTNEQLTIGLIETKAIGEKLESILSSDQLKNYQQLSDNIILTDYLHFILIRKGEPVLDVPLFSKFNLEKKRFKIELTRIEELSALFLQFFESEPETIYKAEDLAVKLADKAKFLREYSLNELRISDEKTNLLHGFYEAFKNTLLPSLGKSYFSDIYSQTITYSLFLAALNCDDPKIELKKNTAHSLLPNTFPLIREIFHSLDDFPNEIVWIIDEIISILKVTDISAIKKEFADYRHKEKGFNDPFIFFYEDFLHHYDPKQRKIRGVYYTPDFVVSFIVRSIEKVLKETFGLKNGLINENVTLLDFATGTGTFLLNAFNQAIPEAQKIADKDTVNRIINERIIKNFYGFEYLVAPYVIAHLKISESLKDQGFSIDEGNRLNIYLTNTLTNKEPEPFAFLPHLSEEGRKANEIKNSDILVILGNPPYSVSSSNKTGFIAIEKMDRYKQAVKDEKNIQPLSDDYIKFIRFAHWKMENVDRGIIGIITNNSYLDGLIHRGMRRELMNDFDEIYILNLHGNARIGEKSPDGSKDENVFDIMQGVAISFFVKKSKNSEKNAKVYYADLFGKRELKKDFLYANDLKTLFSDSNEIQWEELNPEKDYYFFSKKDFVSKEEYFEGKKIDDIFEIYSSGIKTHNDAELVSFNKFDSDNEKYMYRPFDIRNINYDLDKVVRHRYSLMKHMLKDNLAITTKRKIYPGHNNFFITNTLTDIRYCSKPGTIGTDYVFPLYVYEDDNNNHSIDEIHEPIILYDEENELKRKPNFTKKFRQFFNSKYKKDYKPEQILGYIYAILYSPTYRTKYIEFLKIDFPRIPFVEDERLFQEISEAGAELIEHHLMKRDYEENICKMKGEGSNYLVEKVEYDSEKLWINDKRYFEPVPKDIWEFYIGGYQVLDKWLKERKRHDIELSSDDILHFIKVVNILDYTISAMSEIDELTKDWI